MTKCVEAKSEIPSTHLHRSADGPDPDGATMAGALTVFGVVFMPINILAGVGGMSEFSMMTQGIPWPWAYGLFGLGATVLGFATYVALKHFENRQTKRKSQG